jgi:tetratricopeptide (TPR) repeat protein
MRVSDVRKVDPPGITNQLSSTAEPVGSIDIALAHAARLLRSKPHLAAEQAEEILKVAPRHPVAALMLGLALSRAGRSGPAIEALRRALELKPDMPDAWRALGDELTANGDAAGADAAYAQHIKASTKDPHLLIAAAALCENRIPQAESLLRAHLRNHPTDVAAMRMLAEVAARLRRYQDAQTLLERCLELAPSFSAARHNYALVLQRQVKSVEALREAEVLLAEDPGNPGYNNLKAAILARLGEYGQTIEIYTAVLAAYPRQPKVWLSYGHALKTNGRESESIAAYAEAIGMMPWFGEAYWSLANLKTLRFSQAQLEAMRTQLGRADISDDDRLHLHFALGKALEDAGNYSESFQHYAEGNRVRRAALSYDPTDLRGQIERCKSLFTRDFLAARADYGSTARDPIFIVGLPRAGSTLIEQILASHSQVEGTMELPDIAAIAKALGSRSPRDLSAQECRELGEQYLDRTRIQRKTTAPFFIDKMPNNFVHLGLIHLILPNARIIDARRHPLGCCFSGFKQHFARGQSFTYSQQDIGRYYRDYVELMAHFDAVLPGRIHRIFYESMIEDTERQVRGLLDYCGLPFEAACLRFYENERAVRTASSQQVRQPIFREGLDQWRHYEPWLDPMKEALGEVLPMYPEVPHFESSGGTA